jgi:hypothetical protein
MNAEDTNETEPELEERITGLYAGPIDAFISGRDALVKEMRAKGQRETAATVKNLRKPSRTAWALDLGVLGTPHAMQALDTALNETLAAHSGNGDVRTAMTGLRNAVRDLAAHAAAHAARAAAREGVPVETAALATALHVVLGAHDSLQLLRRGWLAELPESDGLDFLTALPASAPVQPPPRKSAPRASRTAEIERARREDAIVKARARAEAAQQTLRDAEARLTSAEKLLREAELAAKTARAEAERARQHAETAAADLRSKAK